MKVVALGHILILLLSGCWNGAPSVELPIPSAEKLPRWRGFNLTEMMGLGPPHPAFSEEDFRLISELGFNFVRLPLDYRFWIHHGDWAQINEEALRPIDQAVEWGQRYGIHVVLSFYRAPGYSVSPPREPKDLWTDPEAQKACAEHWKLFARRYKSIAPRALSFNLVNEPANFDAAKYSAVVAQLVAAIREIDPRRLIIADGLDWGRTPVAQLAALPIAQATRGYDPFKLTHYQAPWVENSSRWPLPSWPLGKENAAALWVSSVAPWLALQKEGVGVMVGEFGAYNKTPHAVVLSWMKDNLENWKKAGWGWALWNFRGPFGILDSERADVRYQEFHGHKLDREMLELLQRY